MMILFRGASIRRLLSPWICSTCRHKFISTSVPLRSRLHKADAILPEKPARTRFAPSPTGYLHLGSLRTALFNYLLAKATGGQFLLRIEDTDQKRTIADAEDRICWDLEWAGLQWDEGPKIGGPHGPYRQSQRTAIYREHAEKLLNSGSAYRCFCTPEQLHTQATQNKVHGLGVNYDRTCSYLPAEQSEDRSSKGESHVIRFKVPSLFPAFKDLVNGRILQGRPTIVDPVILKSDGFPTYHLANVVDDRFMKITHVIRGAEWISSTPLHIAIYDAFKWAPPVFGHVSLLVSENRQKLSKRNFDLDVSHFRDKMGIFPDALTNFVALLGWSHDKKNDIMNLQELASNFTMKFTGGDTTVTFGKLWYLQKAHASRYITAAANGESSNLDLMTGLITQVLEKEGLIEGLHSISGQEGVKNYIFKLLDADGRNYTNAREFVKRNIYFFQAPGRIFLVDSKPSFVPEMLPKEIISSIQPKDVVSALSFLKRIPMEAWTAGMIRECMVAETASRANEILLRSDCAHLNTEKVIKELSMEWRKLTYKWIRWAITAGKEGPDSARSMEILGRKESLSRIETAGKVLAGLQI